MSHASIIIIVIFFFNVVHIIILYVISELNILFVPPLGPRCTAFIIIYTCKHIQHNKIFTYFCKYNIKLEYFS
jgi:1,4-dihydroxy-2-naphthoate octaprenyltransferase